MTSSPDYSAFLRPIGPDTFVSGEDPGIQAELTQGLRSIHQRIDEAARSYGELEDAQTEKQRFLGALPLRDGTYSFFLDDILASWHIEKRFSLLKPGDVWEHPRFEAPALVVRNQVDIRAVPLTPEDRGDVLEATSMLDKLRPVVADPKWPPHSSQANILGVAGVPLEKKLFRARTYNYGETEIANQLRERLGGLMQALSAHVIDATTDISATLPLLISHDNVFHLQMSRSSYGRNREQTPAHELAGRFRLLSAIVSL